MDLAELTGISSEVRTFLSKFLIVPVLIQILRYRRMGWPLLLPVLWIWLCDIVGDLMAYYGHWNNVIEFIYAPVAIVLSFYAFVPLIYNRILYWTAVGLTFLGVYALLFNGVVIHGIDRTGIERNIVNYAIAAPVIIGVLVLVEMDFIVRLKNQKRPSSLKWVIWGWIFYFTIGYVHWGAYQLKLLIQDAELKTSIMAFFSTMFTLAYMVLLLSQMVAAWSDNLNELWRKTKR